MRRIGEYGTGAPPTHGAPAPVRHMRMGVIGGDARAHQATSNGAQLAGERTECAS